MADDPLARMRAVLIARELTNPKPLLARGLPHVRTSEGSAKYNQPIGAVIRKKSRLAKLVKTTRRGLAKIPPPEHPPFSPKSTSGTPRAYAHNARTPDGRVIMTENQMSDFHATKGPHSMLSFVSDAYDVEGQKVEALDTGREGFHDEMVREMLDGVKPNPSGKKTYIFIGGGTASGKSTVTKRMADYPRVRELEKYETDPPGEAVLIDVDAVKMKAPEWGTPTKEDSARFLHEESSLIGKRAGEAASERGLDIVLDGTGDGSAVNMAKKVATAKKNGYYARGVYITVPAGEAVVRALERGIETDRKVPMDTLLNIHQKVSQTVDAMRQDFDRFDLFDTDVPYKAPGIPIITNGEIVDETRYLAFLAKQRVTHLEASQEALRRAEAKVYHEVTDPTGRVWTPQEVKDYTIRQIQEMITEYSSRAPREKVAA